MSITVDRIGTISASLSKGGWQADGEIFDDADRLAFNQAVTYYFRLFRGSAWEDEYRLGFSGHLNPDPYERTFQSSVAPFKAFTAQEYLKRLRIQGIFFKYSASPANEHEQPENYAEIVSHIIGNSGEYGHCNLSKLSWPEGFVTLNIDTANSVSHGEYLLREGTIWQRTQEIARIEFYIAFFNRFNEFNYIFHPMFGTLPDPVLDITSALLLEPLTITPLNTNRVGQIILQGTTPGGIQITGKYPSDPTIGSRVYETGFKASDDTLMTTVATRRYLFETRDYSVKAVLPGAIGLMMDLVDRVSITYSSSEDGISWSAKKFWVHEIDVDIYEDFNATTTLGLEAENAG